MSKFFFILSLFFTSSLFCQTSITVTYPVEKYFIERIADKNISVKVVFDEIKKFNQEDKDLLESLAYSDYYFKLGIDLEEPILKKFKLMNHELKVFDISKNIKKLETKDKKENPYIWFDPILVRDIAKNIYEKLVDIKYYDRHVYKENYERFLDEIDEMYLHIKKRLDNSDVYGFFVLNNELDYFAKRFRLTAYHQENRYLNISEVPNIIQLSSKEHIKHVVIKKDSSYEIGQSISGHINGKIVEFDIYAEQWKSNLLVFTRKISNF